LAEEARGTGKKGDGLVEVETDKIKIEIEFSDDGLLK
jgi:pyruvate/2-oxoglutarate dehydrogenase complex dihydrolipoamide acyltransferase (E2) component